MSQTNFAYAAPANDAAGLPLTLSIYADRAHLRGTIRDDAEAAGFRIAEVADVANLLEGEAQVLGEVVLGDVLLGEVLLGEVLLGVVPCVVLGAVSVVPPVGACVVLGVRAGSVAVACA